MAESHVLLYGEIANPNGFHFSAGEDFFHVCPGFIERGTVRRLDDAFFVPRKTLTVYFEVSVFLDVAHVEVPL